MSKPKKKRLDIPDDLIAKMRYGEGGQPSPRGGKVTIPQDLANDLETVRTSGDCNMFDVHCVTAALADRGLFAAMAWIDQNPRTYSRLVMRGFKIGTPADTDRDISIPQQADELTDVLRPYFDEDRGGVIKTDYAPDGTPNQRRQYDTLTDALADHNPEDTD